VIFLDPAFIEACAPNVHVDTVAAIIQVESAGDPLALNSNRSDGTAQRIRADELTEAVRLAMLEIKNGASVDVGLMQVNSRNLDRLGASLAQAFDPCTNIKLGAYILSETYERASASAESDQHALQKALSAYNTGSFTRGYANGYVAKYYRAYQSRPQIGPAHVYAADPVVYMTNPESNPMNTPKPIVTLDPHAQAIPGVATALDPEAADAAGFFRETALSESDVDAAMDDPYTMETVGHGNE